MRKYQSGFAWVMVLAVLALMILLGGVYYYAQSKLSNESNLEQISEEIQLDGDQAVLPSNQTGNNGSEPIFCTADAKQCPDGSYVSRTGPNCEFVCPGDAFDSKE